MSCRLLADLERCRMLHSLLDCAWSMDGIIFPPSGNAIAILSLAFPLGG